MKMKQFVDEKAVAWRSACIHTTPMFEIQIIHSVSLSFKRQLFVWLLAINPFFFYFRNPEETSMCVLCVWMNQNPKMPKTNFTSSHLHTTDIYIYIYLLVRSLLLMKDKTNGRSAYVVEYTAAASYQ